jgi:TPP-dependent pyruvate/acetoin dehydrogenase alpha subunit
MKKTIFTCALLLQVAFAMATDNKAITAQARQENVKMYQQPSTATTVKKDLRTTDRLQVVRRFNHQWTIVTVDGEVGYVLHSEIGQSAVAQTLAIVKAKR